MSQQTVNFGGTQLAEPPAPLLPDGDGATPDNRRKLLLAAAGAGVLVLVIVAFFLLKGGGGSPSSDASGFVPAPRHHTPVQAAPVAPVTKLPKRVVTPVGRDPFKVLYAPPIGGAAPATSSSGSTTPSSTGTSSTGTSSTGTSTGTGTSTASAFHPVWVKFRGTSGGYAVFTVGSSNGSTLQAKGYTVRIPSSSSSTGTPFASQAFTLLGAHSGVVTVKFGDGTPFQLDSTHNTMVVD